MKYDKFFELAKNLGLTDVEINLATSTSTSFSLFHSEVDNYESSTTSSYVLRGIYNGKMGAIYSDVFDPKQAESYVNEIINNAKYVENNDPVFIFKGSDKYHKVNTFNKDLEKVSIEEKMAKLYELEKLIKEGDKRIVEVESVSYSESYSSNTIINSNGLKLTQKNNYFLYYGGAVAKVDDQTKTGGDLFLNNDFSKFDVKDLAKRIVEDTVDQLNGEACKSGTYKAVLSPDVVKSLLRAYLGNAVAEDIQKRSSLFIDKVHTQVMSKKITVSDKPLKKTLFARYFDDEGVATYNKEIVKNGVLQTYIYNLSSAAKDGVSTTANGLGAGSKVSTGFHYLEVKPGKKAQEELFAQVKNGVYITSVQGLHSGLNPRSGNFSLQSSGFLIKDGKKDRALDIITISGNLVDLFNNVTMLGNDTKVFLSGMETPSMLVKKLVVSGK